MSDCKLNKITKIVITGGPCAGKTTGMGRIKTAFSALGYTVLFVPETATELISGGVAPWTMRSSLDYQTCQMKLQLEKEKIFEEAAEKLSAADRVLIVCDRGAMDNKAYMTDADFQMLLSRLALTEAQLYAMYDGVFHLVTAANGAEQFYTLSNNSTRTETPDEAVAIDQKLLNAWKAHCYFRIIDNSGNFDNKMLRLISEISSFLDTKS